MDIRMMARNVALTLAAVAAFTFIAVIVNQTFTAPTLRWVGFTRAWNTWWSYAGQMSNIVMPITTAVIAEIVRTAPGWLRTSRKQ